MKKAQTVEVPKVELLEVLESIEDALVETEENVDVSERVIEKLINAQAALTARLGLFDEQEEAPTDGENS